MFRRSWVIGAPYDARLLFTLTGELTEWAHAKRPPRQLFGCVVGADGCFLDGCPWDAIVMVDIAEVEKVVGAMTY